MSDPVRIDFAYPGDLNAPSGGYGYDRRVIHELEALGCVVRPIALPANFPDPSANDLEETRRLLAHNARDALIVDGLAFGAFPADLAAGLAPHAISLVHHPLFLETGLAPETAARLRAAEQGALGHAAAVVTTSAMTADLVARAFGYDRARIFPAPPGVDPAERAPGSRDGIVRLCSVGSLTPRKAYAELVDALAQVGGDWRLTIAGSLDFDPAYARTIADRIEGSGMSGKIALAGALGAREVAASYAASDAFVTASHFEGFGMAISEAVAHGLPIVASQEVAAAGAAPPDAMLTHPAGNVAALAGNLRRLVNDGQLRARLADASWRAAESQFRWRDTALIVLDAIRFVRDRTR